MSAVGTVQIDFEQKNVTIDWPNSVTACSGISIITNVVCEALKSSFAVTLRCNIPVRIFSILFHRDDSVVVIREVVALAILTVSVALSVFIPSAGPITWLLNGRYGVIVLDIVFELVQYLRHSGHKGGELCKEIPLERILTKVPNPKDRQEAIRLLNLSEEEVGNPVSVHEHYLRVKEFFEAKLKKNPSKVVRSWLTQMLEYGKQAYRTLGGDP